MSQLAVEHIYRYAAPSSLTIAPENSRIQLVTTSRAGKEAFFAGSLTAPRRTADLLLTLLRVVHSRFYTPPAMLARILALADPVITCGAELLRLEGFSACCGAYARVDLLPNGYEADRVEPGATNVDFNPPMRAAFARLRDRDPVRLSVSSREVELRSSRGSVVERRVMLPLRWLKGFVEVQSHQSRMTHRFTLSPAMAQRFLREAPRQTVRGPVYVSPVGSAVRFSHSGGENAIRVGGVERLRILDEISRHAQSLRVYANDEGATAWELTTPESRFFLVLSPDISRGFSGEGQALEALAEQRSGAFGAVRAELRWQSVLRADALAEQLSIDRETINRALAQLGAAGWVGFDLAEQAYFHRELPFDLSRIEELQPRLKDARKLVAAGGVRIEAGDDAVQAWVQGTDVDHRVRNTAEGWRCTCPWFAKTGIERGPCKHILATQIVSEGADALD